MRSSVGTLQNHYLKNDVSLMDDEEPEEPQSQPKQQQEIIKKINKIVVEEKPIIKEVENKIVVETQIKNKILTDEQQQTRHTNKKKYLNDYYKANKNELIERAKENDKNKYWLRYVRELSCNIIKWEYIKNTTIIKYKLHKDGDNYWSELDPTYKK